MTRIPDQTAAITYESATCRDCEFTVAGPESFKLSCAHAEDTHHRVLKSYCTTTEISYIDGG